MSNLTQAAINLINEKLSYGFASNGAIEALTNPTIYQAAGLMTVEQAKEMATKEYWRGWKDYGESL